MVGLVVSAFELDLNSFILVFYHQKSSSERDLDPYLEALQRDVKQTWDRHAEPRQAPDHVITAMRVEVTLLKMMSEIT